MRKRTLAAYLDCLDAKGLIGPRFAWWRKQPDFPKPDPASGMYWRNAIDDFLAERFGEYDPIAASTRALDRQFGTSPDR